MDQREMPLMQRLEGPAIVPLEYLRSVRTYREACRLCRQVSPRRRMPLRQLAEEAGLTYQHVSDYFNADDLPTRRSLPGEHITAVETVFGNTAISQWLAARSMLTVLEQIQATARAA